MSDNRKDHPATAAEIEQGLQRLLKRIAEKVPSFSGKAALYKAARKIHAAAHNLALDLKLDESESMRKKSAPALPLDKPARQKR